MFLKRRNIHSGCDKNISSYNISSKMRDINEDFSILFKTKILNKKEKIINLLSKIARKI